MTGLGGSMIKEPVSSILLIRLSAIGDVVMASPLIRALRERFPSAYLAWLVEPTCAPLLAAHPGLDDVIEWNRERWMTLWRARRWRELGREVGAFGSLLRARRFDVAIDAQGLLKSSVLARLSGAPQRIGLGSREGGAYLMTKVVRRGGDPRRRGSEYLFLAQSLNLAVRDFRPDVVISATEDRFALRLIEDRVLDGPYAVICPFTTRAQKHWPSERWMQLAARIQHDLQLSVVMLGGAEHCEQACRMLLEGPPGIINLVGETTLSQAGAVIKHARVVIGVDTGLSHLSVAFRCPTVALFGPTVPYLDPGCTQAVVLHEPLSCSPCRRRPTCEGRFTCMRLITTGEVLNTASGLLQKCGLGH